MGSDCTLEIDGGLVNLRVGAIIMKDGKFLMAGNSKMDYLYTVGGRIKFGESAEKAVVREVFEETGVKMAVDRLGFVNENFFYCDLEANKGKLIYEILYFFYMKTPDDFEPVSMNFMEGESEEHLVWVDLNSDVHYYPEFFREELKKPVKHVKHILTDERYS